MGPKLLDQTFFSGPDLNIFWTHIFFGHKSFFDPMFLYLQFLWFQNFFGPKNIYCPTKFLDTKFCSTKNNCDPKIYWTKIIFVTNNIFLVSKILTRLICLPIEYFYFAVQLDRNEKLVHGNWVSPYSVLLVFRLCLTF